MGIGEPHPNSTPPHPTRVGKTHMIDYLKSGSANGTHTFKWFLPNTGDRLLMAAAKGGRGWLWPVRRFERVLYCLCNLNVLTWKLEVGSSLECLPWPAPHVLSLSLSCPRFWNLTLHSTIKNSTASCFPYTCHATSFFPTLSLYTTLLHSNRFISNPPPISHLAI